MRKRLSIVMLAVTLLMGLLSNATTMHAQDEGEGTFDNPLIWADVPDPDVIRVGDVYYMSSTTMHINPGVPIMRSYDLVNWEIVNYVYDVLADNDEQAASERFQQLWPRLVGKQSSISRGHLLCSFRFLRYRQDVYLPNARAYGLIVGFEDGTFRPMEMITREQAMVI